MPQDLNEFPTPKRKITLIDAILIIVGVVVGAGIFRTPSLVAANTSGDTMFFLAWILGGVVSLIGALCYAELCTAFRNTGGDYHFLGRAYGQQTAFLFAWARMSIIQTGSIALLCYIFGDYLTAIYNLGEYSSFFYAAAVVVILTGINMVGIRFGTGTQRLFTFAELVGIVLIILFGILSPVQTPLAETISKPAGSPGSMGLAMVFVLLTYGGWNEAAYISAELKSGSKGMVKSLIIGLLIITVLYVLINTAYIRILGHQGLASSSAAGADLMKSLTGHAGGYLIGVLVAISAITSANATIFTGARTNYALGKDFKAFSALGEWNEKTAAPVNAFFVQGMISLVLIGLGLFTRTGFQTIIEYTAPVFWFFFLLTGIAFFILREKEPDVHRPFRVPLYPLTPLIFCLSSAYLLYSSLIYTGLGSIVGICVLLLGIVILFVLRKVESSSRVKEKLEVPVNLE